MRERMAQEAAPSPPRVTLEPVTQEVPVPQPAERQPWDRREREPEKAYAAFVVFRDIGAGRTILEASRRQGKRSHRRHEQWSSTWSWKSRAAAWDAHLLGTYQAHAEDLTKGLKETHLAFLAAMKDAIMSDMLAHARRATQADKCTKDRDTPLYSMTELKNAGKVMIELGRLVAGEPTEHAKVTQGDPDYSKLTVEELAQLRALREKAKGK